MQSVIVTGAFGVLGLAVARAFARRGDAVTLVDAAPQAQPEIAADFPAPHAIAAGVDLTRLNLAQAVMDAAAARAGIDVLVNVAGGFKWEPVADSALDVWNAMYAVNLTTALVATRAVLPTLKQRRRGRVINIGAAAAAMRAAAGMGAYAAAKSAVHRLTESLADEVKDFGITVNAVLPGTIDTPANRRDMPNADTSRWVAPEAIAEVVCFLASDAARAVNGALIPVWGRA